MRPNILKYILTLPYLLNAIKKSRSWYKKILRDPRLVSEEKRYIWVKRIGKYILWLHNIKLHTVGINNWLDGPMFIYANHQSNCDGAILFSLNNFEKTSPCSFIGKIELTKQKKLYKFLSLIDVLFIDRSNLRQQVKIFNEANELVKTPRTMVIFPEGTRNPDNKKLLDFKDGSFKLAQKAYAPITPVTIYNSFSAFEGNIFKKKHVYVIFHDPLLPHTFMHMSTSILSSKVKRIIESGLEDIEKYKLKMKKDIQKEKQEKREKKQEKSKYTTFKNIVKK